ncbi:MAG: DUF721 domain-containing protein [Bacteroidales bacterium]|nr:DUF721 domain-containing protein [Bacteroidales bacterium]
MVIRRTQSRQIKDIIDELFKESGIDRQLKERDLIRQWDEVVGVTIARSTESVYIRDRKMIVKIRSAVIRNELQMIREGLRLELNKRCGQDIIDEVVIR